jgi:D-3-phosphoglycerate dehydrogenase
LGAWGTVLGNAGINIAGYHQSRLDAGGDALAVVNLDARVEPAVIEALGRIPEVHRVRQVQLDRS